MASAAQVKAGSAMRQATLDGKTNNLYQHGRCFGSGAGQWSRSRAVRPVSRSGHGARPGRVGGGEPKAVVADIVLLMHPHDAGLHGGFDTDAEFHLHHAHLADGRWSVKSWPGSRIARFQAP